MPSALVPDYAIRIVYQDGKFKLQYRQMDEQGHYQWITAPIVNEHGAVLGFAVEAIIEQPGVKT